MKERRYVSPHAFGLMVAQLARDFTVLEELDAADRSGEDFFLVPTSASMRTMVVDPAVTSVIESPPRPGFRRVAISVLGLPIKVWEER